MCLNFKKVKAKSHKKESNKKNHFTLKYMQFDIDYQNFTANNHTSSLKKIYTCKIIVEYKNTRIWNHIRKDPFADGIPAKVPCCVLCTDPTCSESALILFKFDLPFALGSH